MSEVTMERRKLKMHPKLLLDVIGRQAGSVHKALLEGTMNAIEAEVRSLEGKLPKRTSFTTHYATNSLRAAERAIEILPIPSWEE